MQFNNQNQYREKGDTSLLTNTLGFRHTWVFVVFTILLIVPTMAHADFLLQTKDGKSFTWPNFTLEDNNYCTWNNGGQFCVPLSEIVSIKEVGGDSAPATVSQSGPRNARQVQPSENTTSKGRIVKDIGQDSFDVRSSSTGRGRNYGQGDAYGNVNRSSTTIEKELTDEDINQFEREKWLKQKDAEARQLQIERDRQTQEAQRRADADRLRVERDTARQQEEAARNARWGR